MAEKMDVYSDCRVPFDVAAYCRGHKFSPQAVTLARAVRTRDELYKQFLDLEAQIDNQDGVVTAAIAKVREKMEASNGV